MDQPMLCPIFPFFKGTLSLNFWHLEINLLIYLGSGLSPILSFFNSCTFDFDTTFFKFNNLWAQFEDRVQFNVHITSHFPRLEIV